MRTLVRLAMLCAMTIATTQSQVANPPASVQSAPPIPSLSAQEIVRRAMQRDVRNWELQKDYTYIQRVEDRELNADGSPKGGKVETSEITFLYGQPYARLIQRDDKPLSNSEAKKVQAKFDDTIAKRAHESESDRAKRLADWNKHHEEEHAFLLEVPEAYNFVLEGEQTLNGRIAYVISGEPRSDFHPKMNSAHVLPKLRPKLWIDKDTFQWIKIQADVIDTIVWGGFLLRLHPGSHVDIEQTLVNNEIWLPYQAYITFDARVALVKVVRMQIVVSYRDYKKFRTDSRVITASP